MKLLFFLFVFSLPFHLLFSNDGIFLSIGSVIYPVNETRISLEKEVLSFVCDDGIAEVRVYFEFNNPEKKVLN